MSSANGAGKSGAMGSSSSRITSGETTRSASGTGEQSFTFFGDGRLVATSSRNAIAASSSSASSGASAVLASSSSFSAGAAASLQGEVVRQTRTLQRLAGVSYDQFLSHIKELNEISSHFLDSNGKQLVFAVKKGTDSTVLWKATVRVACVKIDAATKDIESHQVGI
jgi:hypothetical protein